MKTIITILLFVLSIASSIASPLSDTLFNQTDSLGRKQGYWKGFLYSEKNEIIPIVTSIEYYFDDLKDSVCLNFYGEYGNYALLNKLRYKKDKLHGEGYFFKPNGDTISIINYANGKRNGWAKYYERGKLKTEEEFIDGIATGIIKDYYWTSGRVQSISYQIKGIENGIRKIYSDDERSELLHEYTFKNGVKVEAKHYKNGQLIKEEKFDYEKGLKKNEEIRKKLEKEGYDG